MKDCIRSDTGTGNQHFLSKCLFNFVKSMSMKAIDVNREPNDLARHILLQFRNLYFSATPISERLQIGRVLIMHDYADVELPRCCTNITVPSIPTPCSLECHDNLPIYVLRILAKGGITIISSGRDLMALCFCKKDVGWISAHHIRFRASCDEDVRS